MKNKIFSNIGLKVISIALAIFIWFFITYKGQSEIAMDVPIEFKNIPKGMEIIKQDIKKTNLNIMGHEKVLYNLKYMDLRVIVDLSLAKKGEGIYYFDKNNVISAGTIKVLRIEPSSIRITIDEIISKEIQVKPSITGLLKRGYEIKSVSINPSFVKVEGANTKLEKIFILRTDPIDISGLDSDVVQSVRLNTKGENIRTSVQDVTVNIIIKRSSR